jgi:hypothetical protein
VRVTASAVYWQQPTMKQQQRGGVHCWDNGQKKKASNSAKRLEQITKEKDNPLWIGILI